MFISGSPRKLSPSGFTHLLIPILVVIVIALLGGLVYDSISKAATIANSVSFTSGVGSSKCMDDAYDSKANYTKVQLYSCNKNASQQWIVNTNGTIENANGSCLDLSGAKYTNNTKIVMYSCNTNAAQQWKLSNNTIVNPKSGKCLDDPYSTATNGTQLIIYTCKGTTNQKWTPSTTVSQPGGSGSTNDGPNNFFASIDTMKDSQDTDEPGDQMSAAEIQQEINLTATLHVNYITDDSKYDYPSYMALWANTIHAAGKHVWFRSHFNCWELDNGCTTQMTPAQYLTSLTSFLNANYSMFKSGDIFDPCPEPENSAYWQETYGADWSWQNAPNAGSNAYNTFMLAVSQTAQSTLQAHGIKGVITGIRSTSSWWPENPKSLYPSTIKALGYVTYDSYPDATTTDPTTAVNDRISDLTKVIQNYPGVPVVLGEVGYDNNTDVSDSVQQTVLSAELNALASYSQIVGLNYWVGAGGPGYGGYTNIFSGSRGSWQVRPAASVLAAYFDKETAD
jgi:hypothetical protein